MEKEVIEKARKHSLNISKVCENALIDMINHIEGNKEQNNLVSFVNASSQEGLNGNPEEMAYPLSEIEKTLEETKDKLRRSVCIYSGKSAIAGNRAKSGNMSLGRVFLEITRLCTVQSPTKPRKLYIPN